MENNLKKLFLAAVGGTALTYEKSSEILDQMIEKGKLSVSEGKELTEDLKRTFKRDHAKESSTDQHLSLADDVLSLREEVEQLTAQVDELRQLLVDKPQV